MRKVLILNLVIAISNFVFSQNLPIHWNFSISESNEKHFTLNAELKIHGDWYVYAENMPEGGPLPMILNIGQNSENFSGGKPKSLSSAKSVFDDVFEMQVNYYEDSAIFAKTFESKDAKFEVSVYTEVQACYKKDGQCVLLIEDFLIQLEKKDNIWVIVSVKSLKK